MPNTMDEVFEALEAAGRRSPGAIAFASRRGYMNHEDLVGNIASASFAALTAGIKPGQLVVVAVASPNMSYVVALALLRLGCRVGYTRDLSLYESNGVAVDAVIADSAATANIGRPMIPVGPDWFKGAGADRSKLPPVANQCSMVTTSSGSTGRPKLIETPAKAILHRLQYRNVMQGIRVLDLRGQRTVGNVSQSFAAHLADGMVVQTDDRRGRSVIETIQLFRPDVLIAAPAAIVDLLTEIDAMPAFLPKVGNLRSAGAYFAPHLQDAALERIALEVTSVYGTAEVGWVAVGNSEQVQRVPHCVGKVVDWLDAAAFDQGGNRLPAGEVGEIRVRPPDGAFGTYLGDPAGRPDNFIDGWFSTGDIGLVDGERNLIVRGRASNVINVGGDKLNPEDFETHVITLDNVRDVGVTGIDGGDGFQEVCAAIVGTSPPSLDEVNAHLRSKQVLWPVQSMRNVAAIPRTANGKIDRVALKRLCAEGAG